MISENDSLRRLWDYFGELKKTYSFDSLIFLDVPESGINSAQDLIAIFESLDDSRKKDVANLYDLTIDEFRELIEQGWKEFKEDNKYPSANDYERYFYQMVGPIIEDIREAAKALEFKTRDNFIFGLLPTREIDAVAIPAPDNLGYIIAINYAMMFFLDSIGQLYNRFHTKLMERLRNPAVPIKGDLVEKYIQESIPESIDERTNRLFVDLVVSYFLVGLPGFAFTRPSVQENLFDLEEGGFADNFSELVIPFVLCHEYAHFCERAKDASDFLTEYHQSLTPEGREDIADELQRRRNSVSEIMADNIGFRILVRVAQIHCGMPKPNSDLLLAALGRAYSGMNSFFSCVEVLEKAESIIYGKKHDENYDKNGSHFPARVRRQLLGERWISELTALGYPIFQITLHGKIVEGFTHALWENNKDKIYEAFLQAKQMLD